MASESEVPPVITTDEPRREGKRWAGDRACSARGGTCFKTSVGVGLDTGRFACMEPQRLRQADQLVGKGRGGRRGRACGGDGVGVGEVGRGGSNGKQRRALENNKMA